jgi:membrane fusion protein (multidrug efflux system)
MKKVFILITIAALTAGCSRETSRTETNPGVPVSVVSAEQRTYIPTQTWSGTAYANREANLGSSIPGRVDRITVNEGDRVAKDDLLAQLSDELYIQAKMEYETLERDYQRVSRLRDKQSVSQQKYDHVKAKYEAAKAKHDLLKRNTEIRAPFAGTVVERMMEEGETFFINPGLKPGYSTRSGIIRLMQIDPLLVEIQVNETDLPKISTGQHATVRFDAFPADSFNGTVASIQPMLSTVSHTSTVKIRIANPRHRLKPGMFARVTLDFPEQQAVFIPRFALMQEAGTGNDYCFIVQADTVQRRPITRLDEMEGEVAISNIDPGDRVVLDGKTKLKDGSRVEVKAGGQR